VVCWQACSVQFRRLLVRGGERSGRERHPVLLRVSNCSGLARCLQRPHESVSSRAYLTCLQPVTRLQRPQLLMPGPVLHCDRGLNAIVFVLFSRDGDHLRDIGVVE
jgi:hypothetical protein